MCHICRCTLPGLDVDILNDLGKSVDDGYLVIRNPWPGMTKGILNDEERYLHTYWSKFPNIWNHGDKVWTDSQNMWYISGRIDDVMKISGHRIDPSEIEEVLTSDSGIVESVCCWHSRRVNRRICMYFLCFE